MRPAPSPLPLLRVVNSVMALVAMLFAAHLLMQRHAGERNSLDGRQRSAELARSHSWPFLASRSCLIGVSCRSS